MAYLYPYGDTQQLNLDWLIEQWNEVKSQIDGSLQAEIDRVEAAITDLLTARDESVAAQAAAALSASAAASSASTASGAASAANAQALAAAASAATAGAHASDAQQYMLTAEQEAIASHNDAAAAATSSSQAAASASAAHADALQAQSSAATASTQAASATNHAIDSEAWAVGERGGTPVVSGDDTYENNSKYYAAQAAAVAASIPEDYSELSNDVIDVMAAVNYMNGDHPIYFEKGGYYTTPGDGSAPVFTANADWATTGIIPIMPGEYITINAAAASGVQRLWVTVDENGNALARSSANLSGLRYESFSNVNVRGVIINNKITTQADYYVIKSFSNDYYRDRTMMVKIGTDVPTDLDNASHIGYYGWATTGHPDNTPSVLDGKSFNLLMYSNPAVSSRGIQIIVPMDSGNILYRGRSSIGWGDWKTIVKTDDSTRYWCYGKKINWLGDSLVHAGDFDDIVCEELNITQNADYGVSGSTIALAADGTDGRSAMVARYSSMADDADIIAVSGGTNDFMYAWCPIGDMSSTTNNTFYGAMKNLCEGLITKYPDKVIFFTTPIKRAQKFSNGNGGTYTPDNVATTPASKNKYGKTLMDYCDIIKEVCGYYGIPVLDMNRESGMNPHIAAQSIYFDSEGTHPNTAGKRLMARRVTGWLTQLAYNITE